MCGYCIEAAVITDLLEVVKGEERSEHDSFLGPIHLQEASDWRKELASWGSQDHSGGSVVSLCRHWSDCLSGKTSAALAETINAEALAELQTWLATLDYSPDWQWALRTDGSPPSPPPIELARTNLDCYISHWIQSPGSEDMAWDHKAMYERFLGVSIALDLVMKSAPDDPRLKVLATRNPVLTPFFSALDLWLQRRALHACTSHFGIEFIKENFGELRIEAIISIILSDLLIQDDLIELRASLQDRSHWTMNLGLVDLLEVLQIKIEEGRRLD